MSFIADLCRNAGAAMKIVLLSIGAAVTYGILQDQVTAHVCIEYFTIGHVDFFNLGNPTLVALEWGLIATWWAGLILSIPVAIIARLGARRPRCAASDLLFPTLVLMACTAIVALISGVVGFAVAKAGGIYLTEPLASQVPSARHAAFLADLWAHDAAYAAGLIGCIAICIWTRRKRRTWRRVQTALATLHSATAAPPNASLPGTRTIQRWETITLRFLIATGACSLCLGGLFVIAISALSGI